MSQRGFTINGHYLVIESQHDHGTWTVYDQASGKRLSTSVRLVADIVDVIDQTQIERPAELVEQGVKEKST